MRSLYEIGPLRLDPEAQVLTREGAPLALGARAVAVLAALVGRAPESVSKSALLDAAWSGLVVEEANLAVQISAIRRALAQVPGGDGWIETLARRGYRFVGPVAAVADQRAPVAAADRTRSNLPQMLTSFVGRERELAEIKRLLPSTRLLTLTGTGGIGKTRLALQAAAECARCYRHGVWFVDLSSLTDPTLVPNALARVLKVKESAGVPLVKTLSDHLQGREMLLILDNCEQVLAAVAALADALLRATTKITLVATSREPLRRFGEQVYPVTALPLPDRAGGAKTIARSDAVQLFVERARQQRPSFDLQGSRARAVADICVRLDGIPLALELAAARVAVLPVEQIERLLDQRFRLLTSGSRSDVPRHQTLRAMLDWSHDLLEEKERKLLARFSVFAGGFTLAAAEAIAIGDPIAKDDVVYLLIALVEQSLVVADDDGDRYRMLETVREYAREKLAASGSAELIRAQHRDCFLALAEEAEPKLMGAEQAAWLQRLEAEHENLRGGARLEPQGRGIDRKLAALRGAGAILEYAGTFLGGPRVVCADPGQRRGKRADQGARKGAQCGGRAGPLAGRLSRGPGALRGAPGDRAGTGKQDGHCLLAHQPWEYGQSPGRRSHCPGDVRGSLGACAGGAASGAHCRRTQQSRECGPRNGRLVRCPGNVRGKPGDQAGIGRQAGDRKLAEQPGAGGIVGT